MITQSTTVTCTNKQCNQDFVILCVDLETVLNGIAAMGWIYGNDFHYCSRCAKNEHFQEKVKPRQISREDSLNYMYPWLK